jgi:ArsR family transcriptional regulator, zinc-responsive transcriptional repressor
MVETDVETLLRSENSKQRSGETSAEIALLEIHSDETPLRDEHFQTVSFLAKSLSDENRLRILLCISSGKKSVGGIVEELGLSQPLVSHHLKELRRSLLVRIERSGPFIYYELSDSRILDVVRILTTVATDLLAARKTF